MKKILILSLLFLQFISYGQDNNLGGTPVIGVTPIKRIEDGTTSKIETTAKTETTTTARIASTAPTGTSQEVGITEGALSVSLTGAATYSIPIAVPPGINGVAPQISLSYSSQGGNGMAGYGWNIAGVSAISRIPSTMFHDGVIDAVDFDTLDRFALDGQRLILKSGTYGADGAVYETENFSTVKITSYGVSPLGANYGPAYFIVQYPDGSMAQYGNSVDSRSIATWSITYWQNPQGVRISYSYNNTSNNITIASIKYGATVANTPINEIQFVYGARLRPEQMYLAGQSIVTNKILNELKVLGNGIGFRNYTLAYNTTALGYERLISITEKGGDNTKSYNPTVFTYDTSPNSMTYSSSTVTGSGTVGLDTTASISGDFDGDGSMDFAIYPTTGASAKSKFSVYTNLDSQTNGNIQFLTNIGSFLEIFPSTWLTSHNAIAPMQGVTTIKSVTDPAGNISFNTHYYDTFGIFLQYSKIANFPKYVGGYYQQECCAGCEPFRTVKKANLNQQISNSDPVWVPIEVDIPKRYISGDFNGDRLTDVVVIEKTINYDVNSNCYTYNFTIGGDVYFVNLDRRLTTNYVNEPVNLSIGNDSKILVSDFNGDGKEDIYVFDDGYIKVYTLNESQKFVSLYNSPYDANIVKTRPILLGDYNGDGKTDFITSKFDQAWDNHTEWLKFTSTGIGFLKEEQNYPSMYYRPNVGFEYSEQLIPMDYDNDGKTDIVAVACYEDRNPYTWSTSATVKVGVAYNKNGIFNYNEDTNSAYVYDKADFDNLGLPIFYNSNQPNRKLEVAVMRNDQILFFKSQKDFSRDAPLKTITTGNGVIESITYAPLVKEAGDYEDVYTARSNELYPNMDITIAPTFKVVSQLEKQSSNTYKKQLYTYYGAVTNVSGLGFLGFQGTMRTNWHDATFPVVSTVSKYDLTKRGAMTQSYTVLGLAYVASSYSPTTFITKSLLTYEQDLSPTKVFKIKNTVSEQYNGLEGTSTTTTNSYDSYNNPTASTTLLKNNGAVEQTTTSSVTYDNPTSSIPYYRGRPLSKNTSTTYNGLTTTSDEIYSYQNSLLTQIKKRSNATNYITEDNVYDTYGNITQKTITASGLIPRITKYEYDTSGRFLTKSTDIEGLATLFDYNTSNGLVNFETNPYGLKTTYTYDSWFKKIKITDYLGKNNFYDYTKTNSVFTSVKTYGDDGSESIELFDDLGRKTLSKVKTINSWSNVDYLYDVYDRNYKTSEPYETTPLQWNETKYDDYGRTIQNIAQTGKTTTISYQGLTTTVNDGTKNAITTKNALGYVLSSTDNGGTINYTYDANGNLKTSNFEGTIISMEYDGWGRKTKLTDPSAGTYIYSYNDLGETLQETTPKGTTNYTLDAVGKLIEKTLVGDLTNTKTIYTYDLSSKLQTKIAYDDILNSNHIDYEYTYDVQKRLTKTIENITTKGVVFETQVVYDDFGRILKNFYSAKKGALLQSKWIKYTYKNGEKWQMLDDAISAVLWQTDAVNSRGQLTSAALGNGITISNTYDSFGYMTQAKHQKSTNGVATDVMTLNTVFEPIRGNLSSRNNSMFNWTENFKYDTLDRLTEYTNAKGVQVIQTYDPTGRITENDLGKYNYTNTAKKYQSSSLSLSPEGDTYYNDIKQLFYDDLESQSGWNNATFGDWAIGAQATVAYDTAIKKNGNYAIKLSNTTTTFRVLHSEKVVTINNSEDTYYTYSGWVYTDNPEGNLFLLMKTATETNYVTSANNIYINSAQKNTWIFVSKIVLVPKNITKLNIRLDVNRAGNIWYDDIKIEKTYAKNRKLQQIKYNAFKAPVEIYSEDSDRIYFDYNAFNGRSTMYYGGSTSQNKLDQEYQKYYSADGTMEFIYDIYSTYDSAFTTFIGGDAYTAPLILTGYVDIVQNTGTYVYLHRDYQGSIMAISDNNGNVLQKRLYDAWGAIVKTADGNGNNNNGYLSYLNRGYTGHEHLHSVELIHMNGRLYDPKLHRFLQPDNFVQDPYNTQNYNRYGYCWNNPLKYTDPSGEWIHILIGAVIGGVANWVVNGAQFNAKGLAYFGVGAVAGALTAMGAGGVSSALANGSFAAGALGTSAAAVAGSGFVSGAIVGAAGGLVGGFSTGFGNSLVDGKGIGDCFKNGIRDGGIGAITGGVVGGVVGGIDAAMDGRNFWSGAGESIHYAKLPANSISDGSQYGNNAEMRADYNTNIGAKDGISLEQVEGKLNTSVYLGQERYLPSGATLDANGMINYKGNIAGGATHSMQTGWFGSRSSQITISPGLKGFDINTRNMVFKHEFMHAWHWNSGMSLKQFDRYSERATSTFSVAYSNATGNGLMSSAWRNNMGWYPSQYSWRNFNKIIPTWIR
jgi:RHS repeat-associated protein